MKLLSVGAYGGSEIAEGTSFDGVTDYLSRATDLVGNVDSKTFTFSCWVYPTIYNDFTIYQADAGTFRISCKLTTGQLVIYAPSIIDAVVTVPVPPKHTFSHILISIDLSNTSNRKVYINDILASVIWTTYNNTSLDFTATPHYIGSSGATEKLKGRLSHLFLSYEYVDLSIEANRRLFITEDLKPADGLESLNPILYLPMREASTAHINLGTGGNFVQNGTLDTATRGANQWNCVASKLDGVNDYLSRPFAITDTSKQFTMSFYYKMDVDAVTSYIMYNSVINVSPSDGNLLQILFYSNGSYKYGITTGLPELKARLYHITISFDLSDTNKRHVVINGEEITDIVYTYYVNEAVPFFNSSTIVGALNDSGSSPLKGVVGEFWADMSYINLESENPFFDSENNISKPVRQVLEETGTIPLIAMPISADNPGLNLGSGGNFTVNGGGLTGARGGSEFWVRSVTPSGISYLNNSGLFNAVISSDWTMVAQIKQSVATGIYVISFPSISAGYSYLSISESSGFKIALCNADLNGFTLSWASTNSEPMTVGTWQTLMVSRTGTILNVYLDGVQVPGSFSSNIDTPLNISSRECLLQNYSKTTGSVSGANYSGTYFSQEYIDFSQEANRNLFVDQLGYPKNLQKQIEEQLIPMPLIYMPFDDTSNLGKNLGTGGDFTVNGTVTPGADFTL